MPITVIKVQTWRCLNCGATRDSDPNDLTVHERLGLGAPLGTCHHCFRGITAKLGTLSSHERVTNLAGCLSVVVMGEEEIEPEIEREDSERLRMGRPVLTGAEKEAYRSKRWQDIAQAIIEARKREHKP